MQWKGDKPYMAITEAQRKLAVNDVIEALDGLWDGSIDERVLINTLKEVSSLLGYEWIPKSRKKKSFLE